DSETITNRTVRRAASALDHDVVLAAEINDVPDDQEISGEPELADERELFLDLAPHFRADRGVTLLRAEPDNLAQKRIHGLTSRNGKLGKFVADIFQRERQPFGQIGSVLDRFRQIAKQFEHLAVALEMPLGVWS